MSRVVDVKENVVEVAVDVRTLTRKVSIFAPFESTAIREGLWATPTNHPRRVLES